MRSRFRPERIATHLVAVLVGALMAWLALPLWREVVMGWNQERYGLLVEQCDGAMRDHYQAKQTVALAPSADGTRALAASEIGLIICQDYDLYQKKLLQWGLSEDELAQMRLRAIEARASDLQEVIETHEIRF
jgi:hypothetical protein